MDKKQKISLVVILILIVFTLGFIWINSIVPATESTEESGKIYDGIIYVSESVFGKEFSDSFSESFTPYVFRKTIHFCEFALLGVEFFLLYVVIGRYSARTVHEIFCVGLAVAIIDEIIQFFSGRNCLITDVLIDFSGFSVAVLAGVLIRLIVKNRRKSAL